jgi:leucyl/phenylalanyl-tRNA--protein transferase
VNFPQADDVRAELQPQVLLQAYASGYFPMPDPRADEILWYNPDPRCIIPLDGLHVSKSLRKVLNKKNYTATFNKDFEAVITHCSDRQETWISPEMKRAYVHMHKLGFACSLEIWSETELIGGIYGLSLGRAFFGESMFHRAENASKIAMYELVEHLKNHDFLLFEVQFMTPHLKTMGALEIPKPAYLELLKKALTV